jgi:hypothetical protein
VFRGSAGVADVRGSAVTVTGRDKVLAKAGVLPHQQIGLGQALAMAMKA